MVRLVLMFVSPVWWTGCEGSTRWLNVRRLARSSRCRAMGAGGLAPAEQRGDAVDGGDPHEPIDDPRRCACRPELLAEDPRDEIELGDRDQAPVEAADDDQGGGNEV